MIVAQKSNSVYASIFVIMTILTVLFLGRCSATNEKTDKEENSDMTTVLPPIKMVLPDDSYLFLPLEDIGFQLVFTEEVDPDVVESAVSFEPELDFTVQNTKGQYVKEVHLRLQEKLQSQTKYTLRIKDVENEVTGKSETIQLTYHTEFQGDKQIADLQWSHDGKEILYLVRSERSDTAELWKVSVKDGNEQLVATEVAWPGRASWSPDDSTILYTKMIALPDKNYSIPEVRSVKKRGREENIIVSAEDLKEITYDDYPVNVYSWWSPDGKKIALQLDMAGEDAHSDLPRFMATVDSDGKDLQKIEGEIFVGWQKANKLMALKTHKSYNHSRSYRYDLFLVQVNEKELIQLLLGEGQISNLDRFSQSSDLEILATSHWKSLNVVNSFKMEGTEIFLYNIEQNFRVPISMDSGYQKHPDVDISGERVAFTSNKEGSWDIYLWENGTITQITTGPAHELYPAWSPKGDKLAFISTRSGKEEIWLLELSSGNLEHLIGLE